MSDYENAYDEEYGENSEKFSLCELILLPPLFVVLAALTLISIPFFIFKFVKGDIPLLNRK